MLVILTWLPLAAWTGEPDLRVLWQLLHARQISLLQQAIQDYRQRYPGWEPPPDLQREMQRLQRSRSERRFWRQWNQAVRQKDWHTLIRLARKHPARFNCRHPGLLQTLALAYAKTGRLSEAARHYRRLLHCHGIQPRTVLESALWELDSADFLTLLHQLQGIVPDATREHLAYQARRRQWLQLYRLKRFTELLEQTQKRHAEILAHRDLDLIRLLAWQARDGNDPTTAREWFEMGLALAPDDENLAFGLLLTAQDMDDEQTLLRIATRFADRSERVRRIAAAYLSSRAWFHYRRKEFSRARHLAQRALVWTENPDEVHYLLAWIDLESGRSARARKRFQQLTRRHPEDTRYAEGLLTTYLRSGETPPVPISSAAFARLSRRYHARKAYVRKQFLTAYRLDADGFPGLANIDSDFATAAGFYRFKSGTRGLDRLESRLLPLLTVSHSWGTQRLRLSLGYLQLTSGQIKTDNVSRLTGIPVYQERLRLDRPMHALEAAVINASYQREGGWNPWFEIGTTPINDLIGPRPTFRLQLSRHWQGTDWSWQVYSLPVRQTLLSYTGWKVLGKRWGRVLHSGVQGRALTHIAGRGYLYQQLQIGFLDGRRTKDNWQIHYSIAPSYSLPLPGFDYFSTGPYFDFQHYGNNQNHFRLGHGGYFSPQRYYAAGWQLNLRTAEERSFLMEGRLALGFQHFHEDSAPWFPIGCPHSRCEDGRYSGNTDTNFAPDLQLRAMGQIHPHLQLGAGFYARMTGDYREIGAGLFLRLFLEPRKAVFSSDLPRFLFAAIE
ncbi:cellulose synthase subunit BcsC-related outer membrane protein [Methylomarinovum tepidoasis]|uniref:cellulose synthase subunit BcsC-related outer membrane protein n=1 Tax=Methylomarinovum tepidoasis TaxID=2840183 RepID=UPI002573CB45|nr:cellulose synthase subunit BcsC-related outer membrane protein [Methylomarinovum sp. IN45]